MDEPVNEAAVLRVERGSAGPEELAALTAVLLARGSEAAADAPSETMPSRAVWARRGRTHGGYGAPRSWR